MGSKAPVPPPNFVICKTCNGRGWVTCWRRCKRCKGSGAIEITQGSQPVTPPPPPKKRCPHCGKNNATPDLQAFEAELADYFADHDTSDLEDWATSKFANGMEHFAAAYELARRQRVREEGK